MYNIYYIMYIWYIYSAHICLSVFSLIWRYCSHPCSLLWNTVARIHSLPSTHTVPPQKFCLIHSQDGTGGRPFWNSQSWESTLAIPMRYKHCCLLQTSGAIITKKHSLAGSWPRASSWTTLFVLSAWKRKTMKINEAWLLVSNEKTWYVKSSCSSRQICLHSSVI